MGKRYNITLWESMCCKSPPVILGLAPARTRKTGGKRGWSERQLERGKQPPRPIPVMSNSPTPATRPADPERSPSLREWLFDALALGVAGFAVYHYRPDDALAGLVIFVGAYTLTHSLQGLNWQSLRAISEFLLILLTPIIHLITLMMAPAASVQGLVYTFLLPGIAEAYWLWQLWPAAGLPSHPLAMMCAAWLALLAIWIVAKTMVGGGRRVQLKSN
jgi:hypothetical protein